VLDDGDDFLAVEQADRLEVGDARHFLQVVRKRHVSPPPGRPKEG